MSLPIFLVGGKSLNKIMMTDDYANQVYDLPGNLDAFNAMYGTKLQGPRK